jgi:hypothetical protein
MEINSLNAKKKEKKKPFKTNVDEEKEGNITEIRGGQP